MTEDIKNRINDLADCFTGEGVPNLAYIEQGILELNNIVNQAKKYEVLDLVSDTIQNCTTCCRGVFVNKKCNYCGADKLM